MKVHYDRESDALYLRFSESSIVESEEIRDGIVFDLDAVGRLVAIEFLNASALLSEGAIK